MTGPDWSWRVHAYSTTGVAHAWTPHPTDAGWWTGTLCGAYPIGRDDHLSGPDVDELPRCRRCAAAVERLGVSS